LLSFLVRLGNKAILNLGGNFAEPLFGTISLLTIKLDYGFQVGDPIFSVTKLAGELLRRVQRLSAIRLSGTSSFMQQLQNSLSDRIQLTAIACCGPVLDNGLRLTDHLSLPSRLPNLFQIFEKKAVALSRKAPLQFQESGT
jgi:hypothetical protein